MRVDRDELIARLRANRADLAAEWGVRSLGLFGSVVRREEANDIDLLVEFDDRPVGLIHIGLTEEAIEKIIGIGPVDLVLRRSVIPELRDRIEGEAVDVFG